MVGQLKIGDLSSQEQNKIFSYIDMFWPMGEELKLPDLKIDKTEKLAEQSLMGFLHPSECLTEITKILNPSSEREREFIQKISSEIFAPLKTELEKMYGEGNVITKDKPDSPTSPPKTLADELGFKK